MYKFLQKYGLENEVIAVGVSGGADSLALALQLQKVAKKIVALTVNHQLRKEAQDEAEYVAKIMQEHNIEHHILYWEGQKPSKAVEEAARFARYSLIKDFCLEHNIKVIATGHHQKDQAETFLLRLQRGSGVFGLSGILPYSEREGMIIIRPQLDKTPEELQEYLKKQKIAWVSDPMNDMDEYLRVKIRKFLPKLEEIGITQERIAQTANILAQTREYLQNKVDEFISARVRFLATSVASLNWQKLYIEDEEIALRILGQILQKIAKSQYMPEMEELKRIYSQKENFKGATLGGCEMFFYDKRLWIVPEDKTNSLMSVNEWEDFLSQNPIWQKYELPYKARRAIKMSEDENGKK